MITLRIFISSPGDVANERARASEVIQSLQRRYSRKFHLVPIFWENLPLEPDMSFQQGIDLFLHNPGVDVAVFILWSRLGSPLGAAIRKADGSAYRSGTEREYDLMIQARAQSRASEGTARPRMIIYTRRDDSSFDAQLRGKSTTEKKEMLSQKELVESFMKETFKDAETGENIGAYHPFDRPVAFSQRLRVHLQAILDELAGDMEEVIWDIEKQGPPFLGLDAFQPQHADIFFGREEDILEARNALKEKAATGCSFLLLSGASGSGKSSLARAGILPEILAHEPDADAENWKFLILTPATLGPDPILGLLTHLAEEPQLPELLDQVPSLEKLAADLAKDAPAFFEYAFPRAFHAAESRLGGTLRFLLVIDQLEEIFTKDALTGECRAAFLSLLETLARSGRFWIIATVRSDFYQEIQREPALVRMKEGRGMLDVLPPRPDAIARLIEEPARLAGLSFEKKDGQALSNRILRDAAHSPELLPLLEFVLLELYQHDKEFKQLTHTTYEMLGGVEGALRRRAESTFATLSPEAQSSLPKVLQNLVTLGEDSTSSGDADKPVRLRAALAQFPESSPARALIDAFIAARLFTTDLAEANHEPTVTVAHESLLRVWPRAIQWHQDNLDFLRTRSRIGVRMSEGSPLLKGDPLLDSAAALLLSRSNDLTHGQRNWIEAAVATAAKKERRAARGRLVAFGAVTLLAFGSLAGYVAASRSEGKAKKSAESANASEALATRRMNDAVAGSIRAADSAAKRGDFGEANRTFRTALGAYPRNAAVAAAANRFLLGQQPVPRLPVAIGKSVSLHPPGSWARDHELNRGSPALCSYEIRLQSFLDRGFVPGQTDGRAILWDLRPSQPRELPLDPTLAPLKMLADRSTYVSLRNGGSLVWTDVDPDGNFSETATKELPAKPVAIDVSGNGSVAVVCANGEVFIFRLEGAGRVSSRNFKLPAEEAADCDTVALSPDGGSLAVLKKGAVTRGVPAVLWTATPDSGALQRHDREEAIVGYPRIGYSPDSSRFWMTASLHANMLLMPASLDGPADSFDSISTDFRDSWTSDGRQCLRSLKAEGGLRRMILLELNSGVWRDVDTSGGYLFKGACHAVSADGKFALSESSGVVHWIEIDATDENSRKLFVGTFPAVHDLRIIDESRVVVRIPGRFRILDRFRGDEESVVEGTGFTPSGADYLCPGKSAHFLISRSHAVDIGEDGSLSIYLLEAPQNGPAPTDELSVKYPDGRLLVMNTDPETAVTLYRFGKGSSRSQLEETVPPFQAWDRHERCDGEFGATVFRLDDRLMIRDNLTFAELPVELALEAKNCDVYFHGPHAVIFHPRGYAVLKRAGDRIELAENVVDQGANRHHSRPGESDGSYVYFENLPGESAGSIFRFMRLSGSKLEEVAAYDRASEPILNSMGHWGEGRDAAGGRFLVRYSTAERLACSWISGESWSQVLIAREGSYLLLDPNESADPKPVSIRAGESLESFRTGFDLEKLADGRHLIFPSLARSGKAYFLTEKDDTWLCEVFGSGELGFEKNWEHRQIEVSRLDPSGLKIRASPLPLARPGESDDPASGESSAEVEDVSVRLQPGSGGDSGTIPEPDLLLLLEATADSPDASLDQLRSRRRTLEEFSNSSEPFGQFFAMHPSGRRSSFTDGEWLHPTTSRGFRDDLEGDQFSHATATRSAWHPLADLALAMDGFRALRQERIEDYVRSPAWPRLASYGVERLLADPINPRHPDWMALDCAIAADWLMELEMRVEAREVAEKGMRAQPANPAVLRAWLTHFDHGSELWLQRYRDLAAQPGAEHADLLHPAFALAVAGRHPESRALLDELGKRFPDSTDVTFHRGRAALLAGDGKRAQSLLDRAWNEIPEDMYPPGRFKASRALAPWLVDREVAIERYKELIEKEGNYAWITHLEREIESGELSNLSPMESKLLRDLKNATLEKHPGLISDIPDDTN